MNVSIFSCTPDSYQRTDTSLEESVRGLMAAMGINNSSGVNLPEQMSILHVLKEHEPDGLFTRELADQCEMSIYRVRHLLLPLEKYGHVCRVKINKHHKWYIPTGHV